MFEKNNAEKFLRHNILKNRNNNGGKSYGRYNDVWGITTENKEKFGSTIDVGEKIVFYLC